MGPICGFSAHLGGFFYVALQSHPHIEEILCLPWGALLCSPAAGLMRYCNLLLTTGFPTGVYQLVLSSALLSKMWFPTVI